jgi:methyltransferase
VTTPLVITSVIFGLMLAETRISHIHETRLLARGAYRPPGDPYPFLLLLYPLAFLSMGLEGALRASESRPAGGPSWVAAGVVLFIASKALKYWAAASLGERWTFRVFVVPNLPLVTHGPYRYVTHPNYIAVVGELVGAAMMVRARVLGPVMIALFGLALLARVRFENRVLRSLSNT